MTTKVRIQQIDALSGRNSRVVIVQGLDLSQYLYNLQDVQDYNGKPNNVLIVNNEGDGTEWNDGSKLPALINVKDNYVKKAGDTMSGDLTLPTLTAQSVKVNNEEVYSPSNKPTASDVGALPSEGKAKDSFKLNGRNDYYNPDKKPTPSELNVYSTEVIDNKLNDIGSSLNNLHTKRDAIEWRSGLNVTDVLQLYVHNGVEYLPKDSEVPFTTDEVFDETKFNRFIKSVYVVDSTDDIKNVSYPKGCIIRTKSYYKDGGRGAAEYIVTDAAPETCVQIRTGNGLSAVINSRYITSEQMGCSSLRNDSMARYQQATDYLNSIGGGCITTNQHLRFYSDGTRKNSGVILKSHVMYKGTSDSSITIEEDCAYAFKDGFVVDPTPETNLKGIIFDGMIFKTTATDFFNQYHSHIWLGTGDDCKFKNCQFLGFIGDALQIGNPLQTVPEHKWLRGLVHNILIEDCIFDGINKNNRNAISILACDMLRIKRCEFRNCTRHDMPSAIDFEPENISVKMRDVVISDCDFYNIGGNAGIIGILAYGFGEWENHIEQFRVINNTFNDCDNTFGLLRLEGYCDYINNDLVHEKAIRDVRFTGNIARKCKVPRNMAGVCDVVVKNNDYTDCTGNTQIGVRYTGSATRYIACKGVKIESNNYINCMNTVKDNYLGLISFYGKSDGCSVKNNTFNDSGNINGNVLTHVAVGLYENAIKSKAIVMKNNEHIAINRKFQERIPTYFCNKHLDNPSECIIGNNAFIGIDERPSVYSLYAQCRVVGDNAGVSDVVADINTGRGWNAPEHFDATTLPDELPYGVHTSLDKGNISEFGGGTSVITSIKVSADIVERHYNYQTATSYKDPSKILMRRPLTGTNKWGDWYIFTGNNI